MSLGLRHKISSYCQCYLLTGLAEEKVINFVSDLMKLSSWEADSSPASRDVPCRITEAEFSLLSKLDPRWNHSLCFPKTHLNVIRSSMSRFSQGSLSLNSI